MKRNFLPVKSICVVVAVLLLGYGLVATNYGLNIALKVAERFVSGEIRYEQAIGNLLANNVRIKNLRYQINTHTLHIAQVELDWRHGKVTLNNIRGFESFLPGYALLAVGTENTLTQVQLQVTFAHKQKNLAIIAHGTWQSVPLIASLHAQYVNSAWQMQQVDVNIGKNDLNIRLGLHNTYTWSLRLLQPEVLFKNGHGGLQASGTMVYPSTPRLFTAVVAAKQFSAAQYKIQNLHAEITASPASAVPLSIKLNAQHIAIDQYILHAVRIVTTGSVQQHSIVASATYNHTPIHIAVLGRLHNNIWKTSSLLLQHDQATLGGEAEFDLAKMRAKLHLTGRPYAIKTDLHVTAESFNKFVAKIHLQANQDNYLQAAISLLNKNLDGNVQLVAQDLSMLMKFLPDVTRLKGLLKAEAKIAGTIEKPLITAAAHLTQVTATLPALGVKIKPMELHLYNDGHEKFILRGHGKMRRGPGEFKISGYIEPFKPNFPHLILFTANNLEFINNDHAQLLANTQLNFNFDHIEQQLNIKGHIDILSGNIFFNKKLTNTVKSKDVVFVDQLSMKQNAIFHVNPVLNIWIHDGVHFSGLGLNADITGNLDITQRRDTLYGNGRITIKHGTYKLPGQTLQIKKGRLLYPPGTLLANPSLDIKMHSSAKIIESNVNNNPSELEIFVRGTAQEPSIYETNIATNRDKALSQIMLAGSSLLSKNALQDKLKLTEFGLKSKDDQIPEFFYNPSKQKHALRDKDLVIGRPLGDKLYMQYLQSMGEQNKRVKFKYALNEVWALGIETGERGSGADLSFAIERD